MPIGILTNTSAVFIGGLVGAALGKVVPDRLKSSLPTTFGFCAMALGILNIVAIHSTLICILAIILGAIIGELCALETSLEKLTTKLLSGKGSAEALIAPIMLFSTSALGLFGALTEGLSGDSTILMSKAVLDFFTAVIFGSSIGIMVAFVALPQLAIMLIMFFCASFLGHHLSPLAINSFTAVGGIITLALGLKVAKAITYPVANLLPALLLAPIIAQLFFN